MNHAVTFELAGGVARVTLSRPEVLNILREFNAQGQTILMVTHDNNLGPRFSRRLYIADGQIVEDSRAARR